MGWEMLLTLEKSVLLKLYKLSGRGNDEMLFPKSCVALADEWFS